jgi:hypothetical protein
VDGNFYDVVHNVQKLKRIYRDLPHDSWAVVAYTINTWGNNSPINASFNIKWAMLLGVPGK